MIISIYGLVRYSNLTVIDLPFNIESIFIKPTNSDGIFIDLSIGYIVSAIFYLMIVFYPEKVRKNKVTKVALAEFSTVCTDAMILIILIYKNVSLKSEWNYKHLTDDKVFFDKNFYNRMQRFDVYKTADTLLCQKEEPFDIITWDEKLQNDLDDFVKRIDVTLNRYLYFLDDEIIDSALAFQKNNFITAYLGLPTNDLGMSYSGVNGKKYSDRIPLHLFINNVGDRKMVPIFGANDLCDNSKILNSYVDTLLELRNHCYNITGFHKDIAFKLFCEDICGEYGIAI